MQFNFHFSCLLIIYWRASKLNWSILFSILEFLPLLFHFCPQSYLYSTLMLIFWTLILHASSDAPCTTFYWTSSSVCSGPSPSSSPSLAQAALGLAHPPSWCLPCKCLHLIGYLDPARSSCTPCSALYPAQPMCLKCIPSSLCIWVSLGAPRRNLLAGS